MTRERRTPQGDISKMLIEFGDAVEHSRALEVLKQAKRLEAQKKDLVKIRIDKYTEVIMPREKAIKKGLINGDINDSSRPTSD